MFPSQRVEDSLDPDWEFALDRLESDEGSNLERKVDADADAPDSGDEEEEAAADDLGLSAPHATLRDWSDDGGGSGRGGGSATAAVSQLHGCGAAGCIRQPGCRILD
jgi:hypothetical protein